MHFYRPFASTSFARPALLRSKSDYQCLNKAMAAVPSYAIDVTITIQGEPYSIVEIPPQTSEIVIRNKQGLLEQIDLKTFAEDLERVGNFVKVAYYGATAAGPEFSGLQVKIQKIGFQVADLCDASAIVMAKFRDSSASVLDDIQATYEYLIEGEVTTAVEIFKGIAQVAGKMRDAAIQLQKGFEKQKEEVESTTLETIEKRGEKGREIQELKKQRAKLEDEKKRQEAEFDKVAKDEQAALESFKSAADHEEEALDELGKVGAWGAFIGKRSDREKQAEHWAERRREAVQMLNKQRDLRDKTLSSIRSAAREMIECTDKENMDQAAVIGLQQAERGLRNLSTVMRQAAQFWELMQNHCNEMASPRVAREFKMLEENPEEQKRICSKAAFKRGAMQLYGRWSALNLVCAEYMQCIKTTQKALYANIQESPSYEGALESIGSLATKFLADVETAQKEIQDKREEAKKEEEQLKTTQ